MFLFSNFPTYYFGPGKYSTSGAPNLWAVDWYLSGPVRNCTAQQDVSLNVMCLNHPQTIPPTPVHGKIVFHKTGCW